MTDGELGAIATLLERSTNTQKDIKEIKNQLTLLAESWDKHLKELSNNHNNLERKVSTLIGVLAGLGILGGGTAGILKLLGY